MENYFDAAPPRETKEITQNINVVADGISVVGLIISVLLLINWESHSLHVLFDLLCLSFHLFSVIKDIFPNFTVGSNILPKLILCPDFHHLTMCLLFYIAGISSFIHVFMYVIEFGVRSLIFVQNKIIPNTSLHGNPLIDNVMDFIANPFISSLPSYLEIALGFYLLYNSFVNFTLMSWIVLIVYMVWIIAFNFAASEVHSRTWTSVSLWLREFAAQNAETFGPKLELAVDKFSEFANKVAKVYPSKEIKVHLQ
ncbi:hypothetical protein TRFO_01403 [Tritrichomonas foetus]|uniref:Uncharacterized protein n=1 Tax=Tritrichomonas foetus TaxID=1144522 RepID=A0A1J4KCP9_9EUKA|nr:hypothetical protein TRFO_01403 [Tritrichomonas foetus]|eukprot:OHT07229.1 hypothetical protein TRFO_01403 [Tritrichomonas foetus]